MDGESTQHKTASQRLGILTTGIGSDRPNASQPGHAPTIKPNHSDQAPQMFDSRLSRASCGFQIVLQCTFNTIRMQAVQVSGKRSDEPVVVCQGTIENSLF